MFKILKYPTLLIFISFIFSAKAQQDIWEPAGDFTSGRIWAMHTDQSGRVYASSGRLLYRSKDLGDNWELIGDFTAWATDIYDIEINSRGHIFLASSNTVGAFRSMDDGETWEELSNDIAPSTYEISINPDNDNLFAATDFGFFISTDNGDIWLNRSEGLPNRSVTTILYTQNGDVFAGTFGDGIYRSSDYGLNWVEKKEGLFSWFMLEIVEGYNDDLFCSEEGGAPFRSTDNGDSWRYLNQGVPGVAVLWALLPVNSSRMFVAGEHIGVYTSNDSSNTWEPFRKGLPSPHVLSLNYSLEKILFAGTFDDGVYRTIDPITSINNNTVDINDGYYLSQNYPNPFNPSTTITFSIPNPANVKLIIYNMIGEVVEVKLDEYKLAGQYEIEYYTKDLSSGVYFYKLETDDYNEVKKMLLMK
jgi:photosystem II stability/assembly factor-like uncharacterized protein